MPLLHTIFTASFVDNVPLIPLKLTSLIFTRDGAYSNSHVNSIRVQTVSRSNDANTLKRDILATQHVHMKQLAIAGGHMLNREIP